MKCAHDSWTAAPHQFGAGKVHIIDDRDPGKLFCGRQLKDVTGKPSADKPTCKVCLERVVSRPEQEKRWASQKAESEAKNERWWAWYDSYLKTEKWHAKRRAVIKRAVGICEGCLFAKATQVHHLTYFHVGEELLFELRAVCDDCHERAHTPTSPLDSLITSR